MREFRVVLYKSFQFYYIFVLLYFQIKIIPTFSIHKEYWWVPASTITMFAFLQFLMYRSVSVKIYVSEELLAIKKIDVYDEIKWQDITRITKRYLFFAPGNLYYEIATKKKKYWIPEAFENMDELLSIIEEKSGHKIVSEIPFIK